MKLRSGLSGGERAAALFGVEEVRRHAGRAWGRRQGAWVFTVHLVSLDGCGAARGGTDLGAGVARDMHRVARVETAHQGVDTRSWRGQGPATELGCGGAQRRSRAELCRSWPPTRARGKMLGALGL